MAKSLNNSKRVIKVNRRQDFAYEDESLSFLASRSNSNNSLRHTSSDSRIAYPSTDSLLEAGIRQNSWSDINFVSAAVNRNSGIANTETVSSGEVFEGDLSRGQCECGAGSDDKDLCFCFGHFGSRRRGVSSTRLDFIDKYSIISVSPTCHTDTSDMSDKEKASECTCEGAGTCEYCTADPFDLAAALNEALGKIDLLTKKMTALEVKVDSLKGEGDSPGSDISRHSRASRSKAKAKALRSKSGEDSSRDSGSGSSDSDSSVDSKSRGSTKSSKKSRVKE